MKIKQKVYTSDTECLFYSSNVWDSEERWASLTPTATVSFKFEHDDDLLYITRNKARADRSISQLNILLC